MKKAFWWVIGIILFPIILFVLLMVALYIPPIQRWAVGIATDYASETTGMRISIDEVSLKFPLDLNLGGVKVLKQNDSISTKTDTILMAGNVVCDIQLRPLFDSQVEIDEFSLEKVKVNTSDFIKSARLQGSLDNLTLHSHGLNLAADTLLLNDAYIKGANLDVALADTVPEDTTTSENKWKIRVGKLLVEESTVKLHMPGDTLSYGATIQTLSGEQGFFDLGKPSYNLAKASLSATNVTMDNRFEPKTDGLDFNHILFTKVDVGIQNFKYEADKLNVFISQCMMKEKSGIELSGFTSHIDLDTLSVRIPDLEMKTPNSSLKASVSMDFNVLDEKNPGQVKMVLDGSFGKQDLMMAMGAMPKAFRQAWPSQPLTIKGMIRGNMKKCYLEGLNVDLPTALRCKTTGWISNMDDMKHLCANFDLNATTYRLDFVKTLVDPSLFKTINIPNGISAQGKIRLQDMKKFDANMTIREGGGSLSGDAHFDLSSMSYSANLVASNLNLGHFVKGMGLGTMSSKIVAKGHGTDVFSPSTQITADAQLQRMSYDKYDLSGTTAHISLSGGKCHADIKANNSLLDGDISLDANLSSRILNATVGADVTSIDLYKLGFVDSPLTVSMCCHVDMATDKNDYFMVQGLVSDLTIRDTANVFRPDDIVLDINTDISQTHAVVDCGDFHLNTDLVGGYKHLMNTGTRLMAEVNRQIKARTIDDIALRKEIPEGHFMLHTGNDNPVARSLKFMDISFAKADIDMTSSLENGLNGSLQIDTLAYGKDLQLDLIKLNFNSDPEQINYNMLVNNGPDNPQVCFRAEVDGHLNHDGIKSVTRIYDANEKLGIQLGMLATVDPEGLRLHIDDAVKPILGYKAFSVNSDNYAMLRENLRVSANLKLRSEDGMGLQVYTDDENEEALQDITVSLSNFELSQVTSVIPYMPKITGVMDGDFHAILTPESRTVSSDVAIKDLTYEGCSMGDMKTEFVYIPEDENTHKIDGIVYKGDQEVATIVGTYDTRGEGNIEAEVTLNEFPLDYVNGFIPDQIIGLKGKGEGNLSIKGSLKKPQIEGEVFLADAYLISVPYGVNMRFDDDPVRIIGSKLLFENFQMYANNDQPLICQGSLDFSNLDHMRLDMRMKANDFLLIDSKETRRSEAYGKAYINFFGMINGELDKLQVRGKVDILAKSDIYYILRDSPITTDNRLKELVTFTDFTSEEPVETVKPTVEGLNINFDIGIAQGTHVKCWMNTDHTNYLDLIGGGNLKFSYVGNQMSLMGRYSMSEGEMKYSLPVIPLKTFKISDGSYVEFTGPVMNPTLNITAQEETKASVSVNDVTKLVKFKCGVVITKTLQDMGLEFTLDAPEDQNIGDQLKAMNVDERGKLAVTMLTTGMYLADGNTSAFSMNSALSTFLQQEINHITGSALRTLDLSVGLESSTDEYGSMHTDYSFKFAKRFWNNRLSISVGGKISTGPDVSGQNKSFFDNVEVQYRMGDDSNQYLRLFYNRATYDYLEGYVGQYGAGYMWKRKLRYFKDIFRFSEPKETIPAAPPADEQKPGEQKSGEPFTPAVYPLDTVKVVED